ncbi:MAG TPA: type II toxin-antitoxin system HipA family toxin [Syntrophales bacterium]|jgi:serine/threonine-protein kinase HipA|nr:type II toxin-antitoxin system HipA family toxin [Syntrophales bacterium]HON23503.1 type II toxin-antitoxin system HipA family toxin [Syntrophales bacterium]HOU78578.1 type II toxin-antitoxin system HipA family toxin [Syntrophales bacterium]HPC33658.1 type II toxin-antitoxin system HipA family toxin [Syntrophales bacterium]HQG35362.1 type II toxin-antitoxin system HipA family toxin [Syntrophales bacterium]
MNKDIGMDSPGLDVYLHNQKVGRLWLDDKRRFVFQYDAAWIHAKGAFPLSVHLPLRAEIYPDDLSRPFFSNLLPEGEVKRAIARRLGISESNDFAMLHSIGGECAGAVSVLPAGVAPAVKPGYRELNEEGLHRIIMDLPRRPLLAGEEGMRLSLAGAQNKLPVYMEDDRIFIASGNAPSSHILKPPIRDLEDTVGNEAFCMMLAQRLGLSVPASTVRRGLDRIFIVTRYDRSRNTDGLVVRLHQEDFCQALGFLPDQKYESEGGPSLQQCFTLLQEQSIRPAADRMALLRWTVFNFLIGNADAHAKNLAMIFTDRGPRLAPFYDLICTQVYPDLAEKLAMRIGGENRPSWIQRRHWERFGDSVAIKSILVLKILRDMSAALMPTAQTLSIDFTNSYGPCAIIEKILTVFRQRTNAL